MKSLKKLIAYDNHLTLTDIVERGTIPVLISLLGTRDNPDVVEMAADFLGQIYITNDRQIPLITAEVIPAMLRVCQVCLFVSLLPFSTFS